MKVPKIVSRNVTMTSVTFQTRSMARRSWTITEWRNAVALNHGRSPAFSTGHHPDAPHHPDPHRMEKRRRREPWQEPCVLDRVPAPVAAPPKLLVGPDHPQRQAEREEEPAHHRPAAHGSQPRVVEIPGDERGHAKRVRDRHADEARVEGRRVND